MAKKIEDVKALRIGILLESDDQKTLASLRKKLRPTLGNVGATAAIRWAIRSSERLIK